MKKCKFKKLEIINEEQEPDYEQSDQKLPVFKPLIPKTEIYESFEVLEKPEK